MNFKHIMLSGKKICAVALHLYKFQEQSKLIYGDRSQNRDYVWGGKFMAKGHKGTFWVKENILYRDLKI